MHEIIIFLYTADSSSRWVNIILDSQGHFCVMIRTITEPIQTFLIFSPKASTKGQKCDTQTEHDRRNRFSNSTSARNHNLFGSFPTPAPHSNESAVSQPDVSPVLFSSLVHRGHPHLPVPFGPPIVNQRLVLQRREKEEEGESEAAQFLPGQMQGDETYQVLDGFLVLIDLSQRLVVSLDFVYVLSQVL